MKKLLGFIFLFGLILNTQAQTGQIIGSVKDSLTQVALESATVSIFAADSSLINYQLTDAIGKFQFEKLPLHKKILVNITFVGYREFNQYIELKDATVDSLRVFLSLNNNDSTSVTVTASIPIRMNGDTLEINPAAFKMKPDAVVEELLNQVPGVTIWSDGSITVNGKKVENLFVDGKPFMGSSDPKIATQNLPKSAIDKIQLYQEYDRSYLGRNEKPKDSLLTMNIKLKEDSKMGYFGKVSAGYGTHQRFETDLSFQAYNKKSSVGIGGGFNNINKNIQNLQELFQNNTYRNYNPNLENVGRFGASGINKNHSIGAAFSHSFIESTNSRQNDNLTINYNKSGNDTYLSDLNLQNRTSLDNPQFIEEKSVQNNTGNKHDLGIKYIKTNSYNDNLNINGQLTTNNGESNISRNTEVRDSAQKLQSFNTNTTFQERSSDNENLSLSFSKSDYDFPIKNFNMNVSFNHSNSRTDQDVKSQFKSFTDAQKDTSYNRKYHNDNEHINMRANLNYGGLKRLLMGRYDFFGISLNFEQLLNYRKGSNNEQVLDFDSLANTYQANSRLTNNEQTRLWEYTPGFTFSKNFSKWGDKRYSFFDIRLKMSNEFSQEDHWSTIANRNLNRSFSFLKYDGNISYQKSAENRYRYYTNLSYNKDFSYPSINQLFPILDDINAYSIRIGNPLLKNQTNQRINFYGTFNSEKREAKYTFNGNINGGYSFSKDPTVDSLINEKSGKRYLYAINADRSQSINFNYGFNVSRKIKKSSIQLMYNGYFNTRKNPNYIDGVYNISQENSLSNTLNLQFSLRSLLVLNIGETFQSNASHQSAAGLRPMSNTNNILKMGATLNFPKNFNFSTTLHHIDNSNLKKPTMLWNAFASYRFLKQQGELKFSAMDLLKQYQNISNSVDQFGTSTRITNGLQQYFLLSFSYYPRKFGKTEIKKRKVVSEW